MARLARKRCQEDGKNRKEARDEKEKRGNFGSL